MGTIAKALEPGQLGWWTHHSLRAARAIVCSVGHPSDATAEFTEAHQLIEAAVAVRAPRPGRVNIMVCFEPPEDFSATGPYGFRYDVPIGDGRDWEPGQFLLEEPSGWRERAATLVAVKEAEKQTRLKILAELAGEQSARGGVFA